MPKMIERLDLCEGGCVLFRRPNSPNYHARIYIPRTRRYKYVSLRTDVFRLARREAEKQFYRIMDRAEAGDPIFDVKISNVVKQFIKDKRIAVDAGLASPTVFQQNESHVRKFVLPYFKDRSFSSITPQEGESYFQWRLTLSEKPPARQTILNEFMSLNQILTYAQEKGIANPPKMKIPREARNLVKEKRAFFEIDEVETLFGLEPKSKNYDSEAHFLLNCLIKVLFFSGMRTNDIPLLRIRDINFLIQDGQNVIEMFLRGKTSEKIKPSWIVARSEVYDTLADLVAHHSKSVTRGVPVDRDTLLFRTTKGKNIKFDARFQKLLKEHDLYEDANGKPRSLYSLRHTYAIEQLGRGISSDIVARNMRTSVAILDSNYGQIANRRFANKLS